MCKWLRRLPCRACDVRRLGTAMMVCLAEKSLAVKRMMVGNAKWAVKDSRSGRQTVAVAQGASNCGRQAVEDHAEHERQERGEETPDRGKRIGEENVAHE